MTGSKSVLGHKAETAADALYKASAAVSRFKSIPSDQKAG